MASLRQIQRSGLSEDEWCRAGAFDSFKTQSAKTFLQGARRLLVVAPHPDDEVLGAGGLIKLAHRMGVPAHIVLATDGEASHRGSRRVSRVELRFARVAETSTAFELLGGRRERISRLRFADGTLTKQEPELSKVLRDLVRPDDLVLTTWLRDGHPDHEACARATRRACQAGRARLSFFPVWYWNWGRTDLADLPRERLVRVPLTPSARLAKRCAMSRFHTQRSIDPDVPDSPILSDATLAYFERNFETFICA